MESQMNNNIQNTLDKLVPIFAAVDEVLSAWNGEGCYQFPALIQALAVQLNWDDETKRKNDPIVRFYVRNHADWHVTRGAHGGIMRAEEKQKKEQAKAAKVAAKEQMKAALEAKVAAASTAPAAAPNSSNDISIEDDSDDDSDDDSE
jgi:hypothetical protein